MNGLPIRQPNRLITPSAASTRVVKTVAGDGGALDVVDGLDKIVEAEGDRGDEEHTEKLKTGKHVADRRQGHAEAEVRDRISETGEREAAVVEAEEVRAPGDECAGDDGDETGGQAAEIA